MTGDVRIENLHIENVIVIPGDAPESTFTEQLFNFLREQHDGGALTIMGDDGYPVPEEVAEPDDTPTPQEQEEIYDDVTERAKVLHSVAGHVAKARNFEGRKNSYKYPPSKRNEIQEQQENAVEAAGMDLEQACAQCIFMNDCSLAGNIERWIDVHPYGDGHKGKRRPGSSKVEVVETRKAFFKDLEAGVKAGEQVHCDPAKRA